MGSIDDLSLISGISNISRISKTSSFYHKLDSTNLSEWQSLHHDANKSFITNGAKNSSKKISESAKFCKSLSTNEESICNYAKLKLIHLCLESITQDQNSSLSKSTAEKLRKLLAIHEVKKLIHLPNYSKNSKDELTLLGILELPEHKLTYEEQMEIKSCLETKLREKVHNFITMYENYAGSVKEILKSNESILLSQFLHKNEFKNLHWKDKIDEVCLGYKRNLDHCIDALKQYTEQKIKIHKKTTVDTENLLLRTEVAEMKSIITKLTCTIRLFKETPVTVEAYKILNTNLDDQIINVNEEIDRKIETKKVYDALSSTEYDGILKKYLELCNVIEKKKKLLEKM